jgi:hypothetical protein
MFYRALCRAKKEILIKWVPSKSNLDDVGSHIMTAFSYFYPPTSNGTMGYRALLKQQLVTWNPKIIHVT